MFALDTDVIISLERADAGTRLDARGTLPVIVTDVVWGELGAPGDTLARAQKYADALSGGATPLLPDTPEAETFLSLQHPPKTEGPGEHSVIAYCHHHLDVIAVLQDKGALRRGVEEIRTRILSFHGFLEALVSRGHLNWTEATAMSTRYRVSYSHARLPVWWPTT
jgi:hypothetical protein